MIKSLMEEEIHLGTNEMLGGARLPRPSKTSPYRLREYLTHWLALYLWPGFDGTS